MPIIMVGTGGPPPPPPPVDFPEYVEVDGFALSCPAWFVTDHSVLMDPADTVGASRILPGGRVISYREYVTETIKELPLVILGDTAPDGSPYANHRVGMLRNIDELSAALVPSPTPSGTRLAIWHLPDGTTRSARVRPRLDLNDRQIHVMRAMVILTLPDGAFA